MEVLELAHVAGATRDHGGSVGSARYFEPKHMAKTTPSTATGYGTLPVREEEPYKVWDI